MMGTRIRHLDLTIRESWERQHFQWRVPADVVQVNAWWAHVRQAPTLRAIRYAAPTFGGPQSPGISPPDLPRSKYMEWFWASLWGGAKVYPPKDPPELSSLPPILGHLRLRGMDQNDGFYAAPVSSDTPTTPENPPWMWGPPLTAPEVFQPDAERFGQHQIPMSRDTPLVRGLYEDAGRAEVPYTVRLYLYLQTEAL